MKRGLLCLVFAIAGAPACTLLDYQDARLVKRNQSEVTPAYSIVSARVAGQSSKLVSNFGAAVVVGVRDNLNFAASYAREELTDTAGNGSLNAFAFGPKFSLKPDRIALFVPVGFAFGPSTHVGDTFAVRPTVVFTVPIVPRMDFNASAYAATRFCSGCGTRVGLNAGVGIRLNGLPLTLRPTVGILTHPGESGLYWSIGFGISYRSPVR